MENNTIFASKNHMRFPDNLLSKLQSRTHNNAIRSLKLFDEGYIDFFSNDYLGFGRNSNPIHYKKTFQSKGSRLISGHNSIFETLENHFASIFKTEAALIFNSGYDANLGFFASIPQKGDTVIHDQFIHASIRDGIRLSLCNSYSFKHNNLKVLEDKLSRAKGNKYVVVESVYSMDGDQAPLEQLVELCKKMDAYLIVDEAHAIGMYGSRGLGICEQLGIEEECFARIYTFGKAMGAHGAVIVGSDLLKKYLINFCRTFIYTTAMDNNQLQKIEDSFSKLENSNPEREKLFENIHYFHQKFFNFPTKIQLNDSPIQSIIISGNNEALDAESQLLVNRINVKAILSPTVPLSQERLRISLHSFNTFEEIDLLYYQLVRHLDT